MTITGLHCRQFDGQGLKVLLAAALASKDVPFTANETPGLEMTLSIGSTVTEGNACLGSLVGPLSATSQQWLEWEETVLRKAILTANNEQLQAALNHWEAALSKAPAFLGLQGPNAAAGIAVYCTLLPLIGNGQVELSKFPSISKFVESVHKHDALKTALKVFGSEDATAAAKETASVLKKDIAATRAALPKVPIPGQRNILITSALPYVNNVPHLGNLIGAVLSADVYARYCRGRGYNVIYICGTDEYGTATETKAMEEGLTCQEICDKYNALHADIYQWFNISFDKFGRTPTRFQTHIAQSIFNKLQENNCLLEQEMEQLYSEALGKFLADRFVVGTCPKCKYEDARGDQCDQCGALLNPTELINPKCKFTGTKPVLRKTKHLYLDLPKLTPQLQDYIDKTSEHGGWSANCMSLTAGWMKSGLKPRCITRDLKWGTPVPQEGFEDKVFYVWFDAPIGYISITATYCPEWEKWWMNPKDVELVQFMGKDNVPFHTVIFPATLIGTGQEWTMMQSISVTEYLNYETGKFSKSRGVGVFGNNARDTGIPPDVWRYCLLATRPERTDAEFNWDDFRLKFVADLNDNLGNFVMRVFKFIQDGSRFGCVVPTPSSKGESKVLELGTKVAPLVSAYVEHMESKRLREGLADTIRLSAAGNLFFQENEIWKLVKTDKEECGTLVAALAGLVVLLAGMLEPFMPDTAAVLCKTLNLEPERTFITDEMVKKAATPHLIVAGHKLSTEPCQQLFYKQHLDEDVVAECRQRFSGSQEEDAAAASAASTKADTKRPPAKAAAGAPAAAAKPVKDVKAAAAEGGKAADAGKAKADKKEKKEKAKDGAAKPAAAAADANRAADVSRLDLRVGHIRKAWRHPDADSLYVEEIDVGEETGPRTVVSGLVKYIPEAEMQDRRVVLVCNMKPAKMRGILSQAMVLAASSDDGTKVELVEPPAGSAIGERVGAEAFPGEPDAVLNPKHKVFEQVQPDLKTNAEFLACYKGVPLQTSAGVCKVKSIAGGSIR